MITEELPRETKNPKLLQFEQTYVHNQNKWCC